MRTKIKKSNDEWRSELTSEQYRVTREKGTEPAFSGEYLNNKRKGIYRCVACGQPLFSSKQKYDSGSGWPSFWDAIEPDNIATDEDESFGMIRTELLCSKCNSHLGHLFDDGPKPTGKRYCVNSASLKFDEDATK